MSGFLRSDVMRMWFAAERGSYTTDSHKMADELEHEDNKNTENSPETGQDDENMVNGLEDDSEFDDPEGFVDDITDEGRRKKHFFNEFLTTSWVAGI